VFFWKTRDDPFVQDRLIDCGCSRSALDLIDDWARANSLYDPGERPQRLPSTRVEDALPLGMDLTAGAIARVFLCRDLKNRSFLKASEVTKAKQKRCRPSKPPPVGASFRAPAAPVP
jgi:hypothetical protein